MIEMNQFDTIYHEHFSYFSLLTAREIFATHGLTIFDVDRLPSHGGSLRIYARHHENTVFEVTEAVNRVIAQEREVGLCSLEYYQSFGDRVSKTKNTLLQFLISLKDGGCSVAGYGAPGKGNTLLNYCGIRSDLLPFTVDKNPNKQGRFLPGSHIPIHAPSRIDEARPDHILILPWNLKREISSQLEHARRWGARFVVPIPTVELL
jgi:hypothetical protein